MARQIIDNV